MEVSQLYQVIGELYVQNITLNITSGQREQFIAKLSEELKEAKNTRDKVDGSPSPTLQLKSKT